jgi:hypothetical protein
MSTSKKCSPKRHEVGNCVVAIANELSIDAVSFQASLEKHDSLPLVTHWR